jgi:hypothetical protein
MPVTIARGNLVTMIFDKDRLTSELSVDMSPWADNPSSLITLASEWPSFAVPRLRPRLLPVPRPRPRPETPNTTIPLFSILAQLDLHTLSLKRYPLSAQTYLPFWAR